MAAELAATKEAMNAELASANEALLAAKNEQSALLAAKEAAVSTAPVLRTQWSCLDATAAQAQAERDYGGDLVSDCL